MFKTLVMLSLALLVALMLRRRSQRVLRIDPPFLALVSFTAYATVSVVWALYPSVALERAGRLWFYTSIYMLIVCWTTRRSDLNRWGHLFMYMAVALFACTWVEANLIGFDQAYVMTGEIYVGFFSYWAALLFPFMVHYVLCPRNRFERILGTAGLLATVGTVFLTARRSPLLTMPLALILYLVLVGYRRREHVIAMALIAGLGALVLASQPKLLDRMAAAFILLTPEGETLRQLHPRWIIYEGGLAAAKRYWLTGMGLGGTLHWMDDVWGYTRVFDQHNLILQLLSELGITGLLLFTGFAWLAYARMRRALSVMLRQGQVRQASLVTAMICSFVTLLVYAQFEPMLTQSLIYVVAAVGSSACSLLCNPEPQQKTASGALPARA
ncbi:MAG: O-antigen ligase family protein [Armatimonadota bacterium]